MPPRRKSRAAVAAPAPAPEPEPEPEPEIPKEEQPTAPEHCHVHGEGLHTGSVKHPANFLIEAYDTDGERKMKGGDAFFIAVRGASRVRAKIADMRDGSYYCEWTPMTSGAYSVAVSLFGVSLPGSPFSLQVHLPYPHAPNCEARGRALSQVMARSSDHFEVLFRDPLGNIAQAVDLDVFVQPFLEPGSTQRAETPTGARPALVLPQISEHEEAPQPAAPSSRDSKASSRDGRASSRDGRASSRDGKASSRDGKKTPGEQEALPPDVQPAFRAREPALAAVNEHEELATPLVSQRSRQRTINIQVGSKPLIVREGCDIDSPILGQLIPGQLATVVEERFDKPGTVRACVTIDDALPSDFETARGEHSARLDLIREHPSSEQQQQMQQQQQSSRGLVPGARGWVTLVKDGKKLVTSRVRLHAGQRQAHMQQWHRRQLNDRLSHDVSTELTNDPAGIGFAFGGVRPGVLHSRGMLHEAHKVNFSIGLVGQYLLHVRLRQKALPIPGSPFTLTVTPGDPVAPSTTLPKQADGGPLRGRVGTGEDDGCRLVLSTADKMGNACVAGGAALDLVCDDYKVRDRPDEPKVIVAWTDQEDGTYLLEWKSIVSGVFETRIKIGGAEVNGSPMRIKLSSTEPALGKTTLEGEGLEQAVAGDPSTFKLAFVDAHGNHSTCNEIFKFGMAMLKEKEKLASAKEYAFEGQWVEQEDGEEHFVMTYVATDAGSFELHVWADPFGKGERLPFPGSPFKLHVQAARASAEVSQVEGWIKESTVKDKHGKVIQVDTTQIFAGDMIFFRPQILDALGNIAVPPDDALSATCVTPDGESTPLRLEEKPRGGFTTYEVRYECHMSGDHRVDLTLFDDPIKGSPVEFAVVPAAPEPSNCKLVLPKQPIPNTETGVVTLETSDKFGNKCITGGLTCTARLQLIKAGVHDQTTLLPNNHLLEIKDNEDGTYSICVTLIKIAANLKLIVNMDKNLPAAGGELPAVMLQFTKKEGEEAAPAAAASPTPAPSDRDAGKPRRRSGVKIDPEALKNAGEAVQEKLKEQPPKKKDAMQLAQIAADGFSEKSTYQYGTGVKTYVD